VNAIVNGPSAIARPSAFGALAFGALLVVYFGALTLVSGSAFTVRQFAEFWYYIVPLALGFGVQVALFMRLRQVVSRARETGAVVAASAWEFEVVFDTHSQELKDDLLKAAVLVADGGAPFSPAGWQGDGPGGHHRKGVLRFKPPAASPASVELRLQRPAESAPRVFRWQLR